eukprot:m.65737 g.65737  ORF g.65737 m.65737 type:complete len:430 (+) comp35326_c0_seq20:82-1371(+)
MTLFPRPLSLDVVCRTASEPTAALKSTCRTLHPLPPTASRRFRKMAETTESPGGLQGYLVSFINDSILLTSAIDPFQSEYLDIVKRLENGREFANHALGFWRKLSKLQNTFAKGVLDLCHGKRAMMDTLMLKSRIKTDGAQEHVSELKEAWSTLVSEVETVGSKYQEMSEHIEKQIAKPVEDFIKRKLSKQAVVATNGKHCLENLQWNYKLKRGERKKFLQSEVKSEEEKTELEEDVEVEESEAKLEQNEEVSTPSSGQKLQDEHERAFQVVLPGIVEELNSVEQERVELLYSCMNQFIRKSGDLVKSLQYERTAESLQSALENPSKLKLLVECQIPDHQYLLFGDYKETAQVAEESKFSWRGMFKRSQGNKENEETGFSFNWRGIFRRKKPKDSEKEKETAAETGDDVEKEKDTAETGETADDSAEES